MTKVKFKNENSQDKEGIVTDTFGNFVELKEIELGDYYIRHVNDIEIIGTKQNDN